MPTTTDACTGCKTPFGIEQLRTTTSVGDRCVPCSPEFYHIRCPITGESIGIVEKWNTGELFRHFFSWKVKN